MRKKTIAILLAVGFVLGIVGLVALVVGAEIVNAACTPDCSSSGQVAPVGPSIAVVIGLVLFVVGLIVGIVSWVGALVKQAKQKQWGWFAGTLVSGFFLLNGICLLIYLIVVPEKQQLIPTYLPLSPYQVGAQYPPMPSYQPVEQYQSTPYPLADPYQPAPPYPQVDPYQTTPQYPPVDLYRAIPPDPPQG
jgi:hypothetical protein